MRRHVIGNGTVAARISPELAALLAALQFQGADQEDLLLFDGTQWRELLEFADLAHLTLPLALRRNREMPHWVVNRLETNLRDNRQRFEAIYQAYCEVAQVLEGAGVPHVVLKGFAQSPEFVSEPYHRAQSDLDIYCGRERVEAACQAIEALGYRPDKSMDYGLADHSPTLVRPGSWKWRGNPYDPEMPISIEVHFCLWNETVSKIKVPEIEEFWSRRRLQVHGRYQWWCLRPEDKVAFLALHILRGVFSGDWIVHHAFELASFLNATFEDAEFWGNWSHSYSGDTQHMQAIAFSLAQSWYCCRMSQVTIAAIESLPDWERRWLHQFSGSPLECMFRRNRDGRLLQLAMIESIRERRSLLKRVFSPVIAKPNGYATRFVHRRRVHGSEGMKTIRYARYLLDRSAAYISSAAEFLWHGASLWLSKTPATSHFWSLLGACFFLTWVSLFTIFSSTSI